MLKYTSFATACSSLAACWVCRITLLQEYAPYLRETLQTKYGMQVDGDDPKQLTALLVSMERIPAQLIKDSGINYLGFADQGPSKEYYPNHGYYVGKKLVLNTQLLDDEQIFLDTTGRALNRFEHTLYHEMGHGLDAAMNTPSLMPQWVELSGWSKDPMPGLSRITIREEGVPDLKGDWYFDPKAGFPRFYAKRNPEEDFADCFAFYVGGLTGFLPQNKVNYFDAAIGRYWMS